MIHVIRADERHFTDFGWLKTYWLFSFSEYYDPTNIQFGALRVFNDDVVAPHTGFGTHPHEDMEIITIVLDGEVTHEDSLGTKAVIRAGDVQRMSAGTGIQHSEFNLGEAPVHFYQISDLSRYPWLGAKLRPEELRGHGVDQPSGARGLRARAAGGHRLPHRCDALSGLVGGAPQRDA